MAEKKGYDMQMTRRNMLKFGAAAAAMVAVPRGRATEAPAVPGVSFASVKESLRFTMPSLGGKCRFMAGTARLLEAGGGEGRAGGAHDAHPALHAGIWSARGWLRTSRVGREGGSPLEDRASSAVA